MADYKNIPDNAAHNKTVRSRQISMVISSLRILATSGIFIFHILGLYRFPKKGLDVISILIFCFISGYLITGIEKDPLKWIKKRFYAILIPYWLVIVPVLIINAVIDYKTTTLLENFVTLLGGNLFLSSPVYVIAWYITFVLLLYLFVFLQFYCFNRYLKISIWLAGFLFLGIILEMPHYFIAFGIGMWIATIYSITDMDVSQNKSLNRMLFSIQKYCYPFFLIHGGVLLFLHTIAGCNLLISAVAGMVLSLIGAFILYHLTDKLLRKVA